MSRWCHLALRLAVTAVFLWAGAAKALDPAAFQRDIATYRLVSGNLALAIAAYFPWLELVAAAALWTRRWRAGAAWVLLALTIVFIIAIGQAWVRGLDLACGCFGGGAKTSAHYAWLLGRDAVLLAAIIGLMRAPRTPTAHS